MPAPEPESRQQTPCSKEEPCYTQDASPQQLTPAWRRPEWVIVYVTIIYSILTGMMWWTIRRQVREAHESSESSATIAQNTLAALQRQAATTEVHSRSFEKSAEATLLNAKALINSERPWILITAVPNSAPRRSFTIMAKNVGRTPATLTSWSLEIEFTDHSTDLPRPPVFGDDHPWPSRIILVAGEQRAITSVSEAMVRVAAGTRERISNIEAMFEFAFAFGYVRYKNLLDPSTVDAYETRWCYWFPPITGDEQAAPMGAGIGEYAGHT